MAYLNANPADLLNAADDYIELQTRAAAISPQAVEEVPRIIASHGPMGYPVAVGIVTSLARRQAALDAKSRTLRPIQSTIPRTRLHLRRPGPRSRPTL